MVAYSFKRRFVEPIEIGLELRSRKNFRSPFPKRQTIRADRKRHVCSGEIIQLYCGMRTRYCFRIGMARCISVRPIYIGFGAFRDVIRIFGDDLTELYDIDQLDRFSYRDGFKNWADMRKFWKDEHPDVNDFSGVLIEWEPIR